MLCIDGSILTVLMARAVSELQGLRDARLISLETKQFSELFYGQLLSANYGVAVSHEVCVWDSSEDYSRLHEMLQGAYAEEDQEEEEVPDAESVDNEVVEEQEHKALSKEEFIALHPQFRIDCLMSEGFYYQMHIQPTWSANSFYYKRIELDPFLRICGNPSDSVIAPFKAKVMISAFSSEQLAKCHGTVGM